MYGGRGDVPDALPIGNICSIEEGYNDIILFRINCIYL